jgi:hypothetical protein
MRPTSDVSATVYGLAGAALVASLLGASSAVRAGDITYRVIDLGPGQAFGVDAGRQVGYHLDADGREHAALWSGSASSFVDLSPPGEFDYSQAQAISGGMQAGYAGESHPSDAILWSDNAKTAQVRSLGFISQYNGLWNGRGVGYFIIGNPDADNEPVQQSAFLDTGSGIVNLHPAGHAASGAIAVQGNAQVGVVDSHAALWRGTAASFVDLHPASLGFTSSAAFDVDGAREVGAAYTVDVSGTRAHAVVWQGDVASAVDINPAGFADSAAFATAGGKSVGAGFATLTGSPSSVAKFVADLPRDGHALLWTGDGNNVIDLQQFLPSQFTGSIAWDIDSHGDIVGIGFTSSGGHAILWQAQSSQAIPLPAAGSSGMVTLLGVFAGTAAVRCRINSRRPC